LILIVSLLIICAIYLIIGQVKNADVIISPVIGMMFGFLYSKEELEESNEITLQCLLGVISVTVIWASPHNG
jgi:hypothetical protein